MKAAGMATISPDEVVRLTKPTDGFLCPLSANTFGLDFLNFTICDYETKKVIFEIGRDNPAPPDVTVDFTALGEDMYRKIKYTFSEDVLRLPHIQTSLVFQVGNREARNFRMVERHYFRDQLVKSFDFAFGFCIPGSINTWDAVYSMPALSEKLIHDMIENPYETRSDSFYFIENKLVMHNKAAYRYIREDAAQSKKSYEDKFSGNKSSSKAESKPAKVVPNSSNSGAAPTSELNNLTLTADADAKDSPTSSGSGAAGGGGAKGKGGAPVKWSKDEDYF